MVGWDAGRLFRLATLAAASVLVTGLSATIGHAKRSPDLDRFRNAGKELARTAKTLQRFGCWETECIKSLPPMQVGPKL